MTDSAVVYVVDDDSSVRRSLNRLIRSSGYEVKTFEGPKEFLDFNAPEDASCLVLDVRMPGLSGIELQERLADADNDIPVIFLTGHGTVRDGVRAMKNGAFEFLEKPFDDQALINAIDVCIERSKSNIIERQRMNELRLRAGKLTPREEEVFGHVVTGMLNKQIAGKLNISEKTVKVHRARVMEKMQASSLAELVRLAGKLGIPAS